MCGQHPQCRHSIYKHYDAGCVGNPYKFDFFSGAWKILGVAQNDIFAPSMNAKKMLFCATHKKFQGARKGKM